MLYGGSSRHELWRGGLFLVHRVHVTVRVYAQVMRRGERRLRTRTVQSKRARRGNSLLLRSVAIGSWLWFGRMVGAPNRQGKPARLVPSRFLPELSPRGRRGVAWARGPWTPAHTAMTGECAAVATTTAPCVRPGHGMYATFLERCPGPARSLLLHCSRSLVIPALDGDSRPAQYILDGQSRSSPTVRMEKPRPVPVHACGSLRYTNRYAIHPSISPRPAAGPSHMRR